jgi:hypothetical protein
MSETSIKQRGWWPKLGEWAAELVLVFIGVYAAFWLNNYQERQRDAQRRDVILDSLIQGAQESIDNAVRNADQQEKQAAEIRREIDEGKTPKLGAFAFVTDYSPTDAATILQGGIDLLDPKTLRAIRDAESVVRAGLATMAHDEKLSDELIVPNLDQDIWFFYDPATKKLRRRFAQYPKWAEDVAQFFRDLETSQRELLKQLQAERARGSSGNIARPKT